MAENDDQQKKNSDMKTAADTAKTVATAIKAAGRAAAGDFLGAAKDLLTDKQIQKAIVSVFVCISLLLSCGLLIIGSAITGTILKICQSWAENWDENWLDASISSNGSTLYRYTKGWGNTFDNTVLDVITGLFITDHKVDDRDATNASIDYTTQVTKTDYETTIKSVYDAEALAGRDGALMERVDLVKNRMLQRGKQIAALATAQYAMEAIGLSLAEIFINIYENPILYCGVASSQVKVDMSSFEVSDIQALKILAAYSVQKDCAIQDIDMYDLMDYLGWYDIAMSELETSYLSYDSIYQGKIENMTRQQIGTVKTGAVITEDIHGLHPPEVPVWRGTFAPQWYLEEIDQIKKHNEEYFATPEDERGDMIPWGVTNEDDELDLSAFKKLDNYKTFGLIDKIYTIGTASLSIARTEYHGASEFFREAVDKYSTSVVGDLWKEAFGPKTKYDSYGNTIGRDSDGKHYFLFRKGAYGSTEVNYNPTPTTSVTYEYYLKNETTGATTARYTASSKGGSVGFYNLQPNTTYTVYAIETTHVINTATPATLNAPRAVIPQDPQAGSSSSFTYKMASFTTMEALEERQAYKLNLSVNISFSARSMDEVALWIIGLWPGYLEATETDATGIEYAENNVGKENLIKYWQDTYVDPSGVAHVLDFERQQNFQMESYIDIVEGMANILGIETTGLKEPDHTGGSDIVAVAQAEYEFYTANNLYEGERYWRMIEAASGIRMPYSAAWCVAFVYACAAQCGYIGEGKVFGPTWVFYVSGSFVAITENGMCDYYTQRSEGYKPVPGDIIYFAYPPSGGSTMTHIGIVEKVDESGKLHIIHGNSSNRVQKTVFKDYQIGTVRDPVSGEHICAYIHPYYPISATNNMSYLSVTGLTQPTVTSRYITAEGENYMISGLTRLRESQLQHFVTALESSYPNLYDPALQEALDANDMDAFLLAWNALSGSSQSETFRSAQFNLTKSIFYYPLVARLREETGFDWDSTEIRKEMLWSIMTSTDQHDAVAEMLSELTSGMPPNITDDDFSTELRVNNLLGKTLQRYQERLWPGENTTMRNSWMNGISSTLVLLIKDNQSYGSLSDEFYITIDNIDPNYRGHAVPELTPYQIARIKNTLYGEYGTNLEACIMIAQTIRDNIDRRPDVSYDDFVEAFQYYGGYKERDPSEYETEIVNTAFEYVFIHGGSAVQHPVYCFYAPTSSLQSDADYQALFLLPLEFIIEIGVARFFCWNE